VRFNATTIRRLCLATLVTAASLTSGLPARAGWLAAPVAAGAELRPVQQGVFVVPGGQAVLQLEIRNSGDVGTDTYDLTAESDWPVTFYAADGTTPLTDTNVSGVVDTGPVAQGGTITATLSAQAPVSATVGSSVVMTITATSSVTVSSSWHVALQAAVPAPFVQAFSASADRALSILLVQPKAQVAKQITEDQHVPLIPSLPLDMAVAETPDGGFVYAWSNRGVIEYALLDRAGNLQRPISRFEIGFFGCDWMLIFATCAYTPSVAVTPDGHIGLAWTSVTISGHSHSTGVFYAVLDPIGRMIWEPTQIDLAFLAFGCLNGVNSALFPKLFGNADNRFVMTWRKVTGASVAGVCEAIADIHMVQLDLQGNFLAAPAKLTEGDVTLSYEMLGLTALAADRALLTYRGLPSGDLYYQVLDGAGNSVWPQTALGSSGAAVAAAQLSTGPIVVAWVQGPHIGFQYLAADYVLKGQPMTFTVPAGVPEGDIYYGQGPISGLSAVVDEAGHAILTWSVGPIGYTAEVGSTNLYYALVDGAGGVVTPPTVFYTGRGAHPKVVTASTGHGNAAYHFEPADGVDLGVAIQPALAGAPPGGTVDLRMHVTDFGLTTATGVVITATIGGDLVYLSDSLGVTPTVAGGLVTWDLPDLGYLEGQAFTLTVSLAPTATLGSHSAVGLAAASAELEANPADNAASAEVFAAWRSFLAIIGRYRREP
jgi:hypothetical protein